MTEDTRPSPDALLREAAREGRGSLKIFLGAAPGVGKTYEMLIEGTEKRKAGADVVIGIVETHGRAETGAMVADLPVIPRRQVDYSGQTLTEMDLDALLERRPDIALVDELAHTNAPGSRHPKRWQDIAELLDAGIDVMTTVNIQHVESLNDVVGSFTHVRVRETVPDRVFENAEIELIDLPPEDLIARLEAGKIYVPEQARQALDHFFSTGNLLALRELALRHAAQYVDARMQEHQSLTGRERAYSGGQRVLVAVSEEPGSERILRAAKRLADALKAPMTALYVETPRTARYSDADRTTLARTLSLAATFGATLVSVPATSVPEAILAQCRETRATQLVIGKSRDRAGWGRRRDRVLRDLLDNSRGVAVHVIPLEGERAAGAWRALIPQGTWRGDLVALALVGALTALAYARAALAWPRSGRSSLSRAGDRERQPLRLPRGSRRGHRGRDRLQLLLPAADPHLHHLLPGQSHHRHSSGPGRAPDRAAGGAGAGRGGPRHAQRARERGARPLRDAPRRGERADRDRADRLRRGPRAARGADYRASCRTGRRADHGLGAGRTEPDLRRSCRCGAGPSSTATKRATEPTR